MGDIEFGKCSICGKEAPMQRTYYNYDIECECHSPRHFELVIHCADCIPKEPRTTKIELKTNYLKKLTQETINRIGDAKRKTIN